MIYIDKKQAEQILGLPAGSAVLAYPFYSISFHCDYF